MRGVDGWRGERVCGSGVMAACARTDEGSGSYMEHVFAHGISEAFIRGIYD